VSLETTLFNGSPAVFRSTRPLLLHEVDDAAQRRSKTSPVRGSERSSSKNCSTARLGAVHRLQAETEHPPALEKLSRDSAREDQRLQVLRVPVSFEDPKDFGEFWRAPGEPFAVEPLDRRVTEAAKAMPATRQGPNLIHVRKRY
jgi:hypothetical protein